MALTRRLVGLRILSSSPLHDSFWSHQAVLEEPEVVLTLASWGFSAHAGFEGNLPPPPPADVVGSDSAVSEISQDPFDGSGGGGGHGHSGRRRAASHASAANTTGVRPKVVVVVGGIGMLCGCVLFWG